MSGFNFFFLNEIMENRTLSYANAVTASLEASYGDTAITSYRVIAEPTNQLTKRRRGRKKNTLNTELPAY